MRVLLSILLFAASCGTARAEWREASSDHFVVYANESERDLTLFSEQLERYHAAMSLLLGRSEATPPSPSNRVTIYVVGSENAVRSLHGAGGAFVNGFYIPRAGSSMAIVPSITPAKSGDPDLSMITLLHEYAHHLMLSGSAFPSPRWLGEGGAEFFSSVRFEKDGGISLGRPAQHRAPELFLSDRVTAEELFDPAVYERKRIAGYDAYYGRSWLLYHYLTFNAPRKGQIATYVRLLRDGSEQREAAAKAFGDFQQLDRELDAYLKGKMTGLVVPAARLTTRPVRLRLLTKGEAAVMPLRIRSRRGVDEKRAAELLPRVREVAARFPQDATVLSALAEAEYDAGHDGEAIAAADAALAIDPAQADAYIQKGLALFRQARTSSDKRTAYRKAREPFIALNKLENDNPIPLMFFYRSFVEEGKSPSPVARQGLERAAELAPFDLGLRLTLAIQQLQNGERGAARRNIAPVAYNPHGGRSAELARKVLERIDTDPSWTGRDGLGELGGALLGANEDNGDGKPAA